MKTDIREEMQKRLPRFAQPFLTWMTGKAYSGQRPLWNSNSGFQLITALVSLYGGAATVVFAIKSESFIYLPLIPLAWIFMVGAARKIQVTLVHQCAHNNFSGNSKLDRWCAEILGSLILVDNFDNYIFEHIRVHHTKRLGSEIDPDCKFLLQLGFSSKMTKNELWKQLFRSLTSILYHFNFLKARFRANFISAPKQRKVIAVLITMMPLIILTHFTSIHFFAFAFIFAWAIPILFLYHMAALLNFSSLHFWLKPLNPELNAKQTLCSYTAGRFLGEALPKRDLSGFNKIYSWVTWINRMLFIHLPCRIGVLSGDLPVHDYHHRHPHCKDWADYLYTRQWDIDSGCKGWDEPYSENWGLINCLDAVFKNMSETKIVLPQEFEISDQRKGIMECLS